MEENNTVHSGFWSNMFKSPPDIPESEIFQNLPPFKLLNKKDIELLSSILHNRNYVAGEYIFCEGDPGIGLYIIQEGQVEIRTTDEHDRVIPIAKFNKGDFFGELALIDGEKRSATAVALSDIKLSVLFKPDLDEFVTKFPKKGIKILQGIAQIIALRLRKVDMDLVDMKSKIPYQENLFTEKSNP